MLPANVSRPEATRTSEERRSRGRAGDERKRRAPSAAASRAARRDSSPRTTGRSRVSGAAVAFAVGDVVDQVGGAGSSAVRDEGRAGLDRSGSPILAAKTKPCEQQRFFDHCRGRVAVRTARPGERRAGKGNLPVAEEPRPRSTTRRQDELEAGCRGRPRSGGRSSPPSATAAHERSPARPGSLAIMRPERAEDPLLLLGPFPGRLSWTATRISPFSALSARSTLPRWRSSGTRSRQVRDDLQDAIAVGDDHRLRQTSCE